LSNKVVGLCADNTNSNFGGAARRVQNNVYRLLEKSLKRSLIGIGCAAHIINNSVQTATDCLLTDVQSVVAKEYSYFHIYTVRVESLKDFCNFVQVEYQQLLGYSKTRWLALVPAVGRLIDMFEPLKSYFLSENKCPTALKKFFTNPVAECWLLFAHAQAASFHETVLEVEGQNISMVEVGAALERLKAKLLERRDNKFVPAKVRMLLTCLEDDGLVNLSQFMNAVDDYYQTSIDYLEQWTSHFLDVTNFRWMTLTKAPLWTEVN